MSTDINLFKLPTAESRIIKAVLDTDAEISVVVPDKATPAQIFEQLSVCCRAMGHLENAKGRLLPVIGRLLILCQENPEVYLERPEHYTDFQDFLKRCIQTQLGLSRSSCYAAIQTIKQWPNLAMSDYAEIGVAKFGILNRFASQNGTSSRTLLNRAKKMSVRQLRDWAVQTGRIERGEDTPALISIGCNLAQKKHWEEFIRNPKTIEAAKSDNAMTILEACVAEFSGEYGIGEE